MFIKRFSLESAYLFGARIVMNHFMFFLLSMFIGTVVCAVQLLVLGIIDITMLRYHIAPLFKMFKHAFAVPTGSLHYAGLTMRDGISKVFPSDVVNQTLGQDIVSFDVAGYDLSYILMWVVPTALVAKLILEMISVGWTKIALDLNSGKTVSVKYLFSYYYLVPRVFLVNLVVFVATVAGTLLFIVPGIFVYQRLRFTRYFIIDKNLSMVKAFQSSWAITQGATLQLFGFTLVSAVFDAIGYAITFFSFFTIPLQNQTEANVYTQLVSGK